MRPFAALLLVLFASAPFAGCLDAADVVEDAAAAAAAGTAGACREGRISVIDWSPPGAPGGGRRGKQVDVEVPAGARGLEVKWTPPAASVGSHDVALADPAGKTVFRNSVDVGVTFVGGSVSVGGMRNNGDAVLRAVPGTYSFSWFVEGEYVDGRLVVDATGCF